VTARDCDSLESGMDAERGEEPADVIASGRVADVHVVGDLSGRTALLK